MSQSLSLFFSVFGLIFVAELPDKTAFASLLLATQNRPLPVFVGACLAFLVQSTVAIAAGSVLGLLPPALVHRLSGVLFVLFAFMAWRRHQASAQGLRVHSRGFWKTAFSSFVAIFLAEWGDLTQLATAVLEARYHSPAILFVASVLALWTVTGIAVVLGSTLKHAVSPRVLNGIAAITLAAVGGLLLAGTI